MSKLSQKINLVKVFEKKQQLNFSHNFSEMSILSAKLKKCRF